MPVIILLRLYSVNNPYRCSCLATGTLVQIIAMVRLWSECCCIKARRYSTDGPVSAWLAQSSGCSTKRINQFPCDLLPPLLTGSTFQVRQGHTGHISDARELSHLKQAAAWSLQWTGQWCSDGRGVATAKLRGFGGGGMLYVSIKRRLSWRPWKWVWGP